MHTPPLPRKTHFWKLFPAGPARRDGTTALQTRSVSEYGTGPDSVFRCGMRLGSVQRVYSDAERVRGHPAIVFRCGMRLGSVQKRVFRRGKNTASAAPCRFGAVGPRPAGTDARPPVTRHGRGPGLLRGPRAARMNCFLTLETSLSVTSASEAQEAETCHATSSMEATSAAGQSTRAPTRSRM